MRKRVTRKSGIRSSRLRQQVLGSTIDAPGSDPAELYVGHEQDPDTPIEAMELARRWYRDNLFLSTGINLQVAFANHGFRLRPADGSTGGKAFGAWWRQHRADVRRFVRETFEDWFTLDNSVAFWRQSGHRRSATRVFLLKPEDCTYTDTFGVEKLKVRLQWKREDVENVLTTVQVERYTGQQTTLDPTKGEYFAVLKRARVGDGFGWPRMKAVFDDLVGMSSLQASDKLWAFISRTVIRQFKLGHEIRNGQWAGSGRWFWTKARGDAIRKFFEGRLGILDYTSNFDVSLEFPFPSAERWDARRYEGFLQRLALWLGPPGLLLYSRTPNEFLMKLLRAWAEEERENVAAHVSRVVNAVFAPPVEVVPTWSSKLFSDGRQMAELVRFLLQAGPLSQASALEEAGYDPEDERARKLTEAGLSKDAVLPIFDPAHGKRPSQPVGRPSDQ